MPIQELSREQLAGLVRRLPADEQQKLLAELRTEVDGRVDRESRGQAAARQLCRERGIDWDAMDDDARLAFVDDLIHEDRGCV